ncbi:hypothetical protein ARMSODRAFT_713261 [Armillaria solidipes]|uniref:TPR-like protein n=1 Tax=Armillaria solidipes TaxID=1076256 RepID=A0A2H3C3Z3_9AGAR|nr:hypothetical protein ARMSODRAFT_713261 [Armillaria solidipes]
MADANALKDLGNKAFSAKEYDELPEGYSKVDPSAPTSSPPPPQQAASSSQPSASTSAPPPPASEDVEMDEEVAEEAKAKKEAGEAKRIGGEAYKKRNFDEALQQFQKAWDLWPKDITFLTNLAGEHFLHSVLYAIHNLRQLCISNKETTTRLLKLVRKQWKKVVRFVQITNSSRRHTVV